MAMVTMDPLLAGLILLDSRALSSLPHCRALHVAPGAKLRSLIIRMASAAASDEEGDDDGGEAGGEVGGGDDESPVTGATGEEGVHLSGQGVEGLERGTRRGAAPFTPLAAPIGQGGRCSYRSPLRSLTWPSSLLVTYLAGGDEAKALLPGCYG
uniref:Uncharacterized protein n=1 Tax=Oryza punctata TaxID=4537 RepID=A0A0E0KD01_ORYPU